MAAKAVFSIEEFCLDNGISEGTYFKLKKCGRGPREMDVSAPGAKRKKPLITAEAAAEWRSKLEAETAVAAAAAKRPTSAAQ